MTGSGGLSVTPTGAGYAYSGTAVGDFTTLDFGFNVDLGSGAISDGYMKGVGQNNGIFSITGGTGGLVGAEYPIQGFAGTPHDAGNTGIWIDGSFTPGDPSALANSVLFTDPSFTNIDFAGGISAPKLP